MKRINRKTILKLGIIASIIVFFTWYANPERRIFSMVKRNLSEYEIAAEQMLNGEVPAYGINVSGVNDVKVSLGDLPVMHMDEMAKLTEQEENVWTWQGVGDNDGVIKKITDGWYYYEASF